MADDPASVMASNDAAVIPLVRQWGLLFSPSYDMGHSVPLGEKKVVGVICAKIIKRHTPYNKYGTIRKLNLYPLWGAIDLHHNLCCFLPNKTWRPCPLPEDHINFSLALFKTVKCQEKLHIFVKIRHVPRFATFYGTVYAINWFINVGWTVL